MMHVMSAPPSSAAAGTSAAGRTGRSDSDGDFASMLAAQAPPATDPEARVDDAPGLPSASADEGEASGDPGVSSDVELSAVLTIVPPAPVPVDVATPSSVDGSSDDEGSDPARLMVEGAATTERTADESATTTSTLAPVSTTGTTTAGEATSSQASPSEPAFALQAQEATSTKPDEARAATGSAEALGPDGGVAGATDVEADMAGTVRTAHVADGTFRADQPAAAAGRSAAADAQAGAGTAAGRTDTVDGARRPSATEPPAVRVSAPGQADMAAAASATSDVDGAVPAASRPAEGPQPLPSTVLDRVMRAVEALENAPPPKRVSFEVDGLRLTVSLRGDEVNVAVRGGGDLLGAGWQRDLDGALRGRGLGLADGQGSDADRGDGRQHPDDRPPHRPAGRGPAFHQPSESDGDTSTNLHL